MLIMSLLPLILAVQAGVFISIAQAIPQNSLNRRSIIVTADQILQISPASITCIGAPYPNECRTAEQVASAIAPAMEFFGISAPGEAAAVLSLIAFESADFKYQKNYFPGNPGQGTRNMQMFPFNLQYAQSIPLLAQKLTTITEGSSTLTSEKQNQVRDLLTGMDAIDFGSGAWFLRRRCTPSVQEAIRKGGSAAWESYITGCIATTVTPQRRAYWERATKTFGLII